MNKEFPHYVTMPIQQVMADPDEYIIPENQRAIEYLWNMNILTTQTNDYENVDSWIALGMLSKENNKILAKMEDNPNLRNDNNPGVLKNYGRGIRIPLKPGTKDTFEDFLPLMNLFQMQDVQRDGYMTIDEFAVNYTDCYTFVDIPYLALEPNFRDFENPMDYVDALIDFDRMKYPKSQHMPIFDESKATKSIEEYIEEAGFGDCYDAEEQKIFLNRRLYEGHMRYKNQMLEESKPQTR